MVPGRTYMVESESRCLRAARNPASFGTKKAKRQGFFYLQLTDWGIGQPTTRIARPPLPRWLLKGRPLVFLLAFILSGYRSLL